jgi:hypothetical protein
MNNNKLKIINFPKKTETEKQTIDRHVNEMLKHDNIDKGILSALYFALGDSLFKQYAEDEALK